MSANEETMGKNGKIGVRHIRVAMETLRGAPQALIYCR
jgi:hypothetical protein